jgi:hypothetical protein
VFLRTTARSMSASGTTSSLTQRVEQRRHHTPVDRVQDAIVDAPQPGSQLVNAIPQGVDLRPSQLVTQLPQAFKSDHTLGKSARLNPPQLGQPQGHRVGAVVILENTTVVRGTIYDLRWTTPGTGCMTKPNTSSTARPMN